MSPKSLLIAAAAVLVGAVQTAAADPLTYDFVATLQGGPLMGDTFPGTISFDPAGMGAGALLTSIDFTFLGRHFTRADIFAGGEPIFTNGTLLYFTAAFELLTDPVPLTTLVFGFGGPGTIGYQTSLPNGGGGGTYTLSGPVDVPEPASLSLIIVLPALLLRRKTRATAAPIQQNASLRCLAKPS